MDRSLTSTELGLHLDDESWCTAYAFRVRWPDGFSCPACGTRYPEQWIGRKLVCHYCGRYGSITSGTLLHGSKKRLSHLLRTLWWASGEKSSLTIRKLQHFTGLTSYQTAWFWMRKLRLVISRTLKKCCGTVLSGACPAAPRDGPGVLLVAIESTARGRTTGRLRMRHCQQLDTNHIERFCSEVVEPGSVILFPAAEPFISVRLREMLLTTETTPSDHEVVRTICSAYRFWLSREKKRCSRTRSCQDLIDEYCFFHNGQLYSNRLLLFEDLVSDALSSWPQNGRPRFETQPSTRGASCI